MAQVYDSHRTYSLAASLISRWEGFKPDLYEDSTGVRTVGFGFTEALPFWEEIEEAVPLTKEEADRFLVRALEEVYVPAVRRFTDGKLDAPHKVAALASWTYNIGPGAASRSTLAQRIREGREEEAERELLKWVHAGGEVMDGLVARREAERRMMERDERTVSSPESMGVSSEEVPTANVENIPTEGLPPTDTLAEHVPERVQNRF